MNANDPGLRVIKNVTGVAAIFYFFVPIVLRFLIKKDPTVATPSAVDQFLAWTIFRPLLHQYDIALAKNNAMYYLAFYVSLFLVCVLCWVIAFYILKIIYRIFKRA